MRASIFRPNVIDRDAGMTVYAWLLLLAPVAEDSNDRSADD
jgi:hypothetical protein